VLLDRPHHGTPVGLLIALGLLALCLLAIPLALLARRFDRFPGARHAWGEPPTAPAAPGPTSSTGRGGPLKEQLPWWIAGRCSASAWSRSAGC
jgi:hypothetical protein